MITEKSKTSLQKSYRAITHLSLQDWKQVNELLANPPQPNDKLKKLLDKGSNNNK